MNESQSRLSRDLSVRDMISITYDPSVVTNLDQTKTVVVWSITTHGEAFLHSDCHSVGTVFLA